MDPKQLATQEPADLDLQGFKKKDMSGFRILSVTSQVNCIVACFLINVVYLTAYAFIRS